MRGFSEGASPAEEAARLPVVYAGTLARSLSGTRLPGEHGLLSEWDVLPRGLSAALERASTLILLDLFSFPYETLSDGQWEVPLIVVLPEGFDAGFLRAVFGRPLFERLGFSDRITAADDDVWNELSREYRWAGGQRIEPEGAEVAAVTAGLLGRLGEEAALDTPSGGMVEGYVFDARRYWRERGETFARRAPHRAVCSPHHGPQFNKALHRAQARVLEPEFDAARGGRAEDVPFDVLEVGCGVGRWAMSFDPETSRFYGLDVSPDMVSAARENFPEASFETLGDDLSFPHPQESFDLVFTATVMHHNDTEAKLRLISEMWRVAKPGGRLTFLEDFVFGEQDEGSVVYPMSVLRFMDLLREATGGEVVLEHVESLRYPHDDLTRAAVISVSKIGVPRRW